MPADAHSNITPTETLATLIDQQLADVKAGIWAGDTLDEFQKMLVAQLQARDRLIAQLSAPRAETRVVLEDLTKAIVEIIERNDVTGDAFDWEVANHQIAELGRSLMAQLRIRDDAAGKVTELEIEVGRLKARLGAAEFQALTMASKDGRLEEAKAAIEATEKLFLVERLVREAEASLEATLAEYRFPEKQDGESTFLRVKWAIGALVDQMGGTKAELRDLRIELAYALGFGQGDPMPEDAELVSIVKRRLKEGAQHEETARMLRRGIDYMIERLGGELQDNDEARGAELNRRISDAMRWSGVDSETAAWRQWAREELGIGDHVFETDDQIRQQLARRIRRLELVLREHGLESTEDAITAFFRKRAVERAFFQRKQWKVDDRLMEIDKDMDAKLIDDPGFPPHKLSDRLPELDAAVGRAIAVHGSPLFRSRLVNEETGEAVPEPFVFSLEMLADAKAHIHKQHEGPPPQDTPVVSTDEANRWQASKLAEGVVSIYGVELTERHRELSKMYIELCADPGRAWQVTTLYEDMMESERTNMKRTNKVTDESEIEKRIERCAMAAHEQNRIYCQGIGDDTQVPWSDAPDWQKRSAVEGVKGVLYEGNTPEQSHEGWLRLKEAEGWVWGPEKVPEKKIHPCMKPYRELPPQQRHKDALFVLTVESTAISLGWKRKEKAFFDD